MWSHKLKVSIEAREMRITIWVAVCITAFLLLYGVLDNWDIIESFIFLLPGVATIAIGYLVWGKRPKKRPLVIAYIISIAIVVLYSILLLFIIVLLQDFGNMVDDMYEPNELIGQDAINVFPEWIAPFVQDTDSTYYGTQSWEEPITFIAYNIEPIYRDSVINDWLGVDHSTIDTIKMSSISASRENIFDSRQQYWNPKELGHPVGYQYPSDSRIYRKIAIYDSLGTRVLLYSWHE